MSTDQITQSDELFASLPSGIDLCYQTFGDPGDPPILLVMGLGGPMGWWSPAFCSALAARGFFVIRYDNRDTGRSTKISGHRVTKGSLVKAFLGRPVPAPYSLRDMADDALGLIDHLGLKAVHLVGVSMGGMIVQTFALAHPDRALSMTSIMSTTGRRTVGWQHPRLIPKLLAPVGPTRDDYIERSIKGSRMIESPDYPLDLDAALARAGETYDRGWTPSGVVRQMLAILTQPDRTADLGALDLPVTVIHGLADPLVHRSGGRATANAIPGAQLLEIEGMAHDLPPALDATLIDAIVATAQRV